jgi:ribosomal RNA-processing protein 12
LEEAIRGAKRGGKKEGANAAKEVETGSDESRAIALLTFVKNMGTAWPQSVSSLLLLSLGKDSSAESLVF